MKKTGLLKGMLLCSRYSKMNAEQRAALQKKRLLQIVDYARANSPYYKELYKNIDRENFTLTDLPPVNKVELMRCFDLWLPDRSVCLSDIEDFMKDLDHIGRKFRKKYSVYTTSGSTGNPLVALYDSSSDNVMGAVSAARAYARKEDLNAFIGKGGKTIGVFATGGFYLGNSSVRSRLLKMPWKKRQMAVTSALLPTETIVEQLNAFQPAMLGGYPSNLELLIEEQQSGRLHIRPVIIMTGGEYLSDSLRSRLAEAFHCYVQTTYSCTEGGTVACECREKHFHINDDWVIVEPVDRNNQPVADGVQSDKLLLTNLFNYAQPYIRYEVTDRIIMHHEPCSCGNPSPWIELEGRTDDVVILTQGDREIRLAPLAVYATLKEIHLLKRFQLIVNPHNRLELRLEPAEGADMQTAFDRARETLTAYFASHNVTGVTISLSAEPPKQHPVSGKFKHIICHTK